MVLVAATLFGVNGTVAKVALSSGLTSLRLTEARCAGAFAGLTLIALVRGRSTLRVARRELVPLAVEAQARTARQIADAAWRAHAPALALSRRGRRFLAAAFVAGTAADHLARRPGLDPLRFAALRAADDLAYCAGVWAGCARARTAAPLIPDAASRRGGDRPAQRSPLRSTLNLTVYRG